jgi:hypothetical protein
MAYPIHPFALVRSLLLEFGYEIYSCFIIHFTLISSGPASAAVLDKDSGVNRSSYFIFVAQILDFASFTASTNSG